MITRHKVIDRSSWIDSSNLIQAKQAFLDGTAAAWGSRCDHESKSWRKILPVTQLLLRLHGVAVEIFSASFVASHIPIRYSSEISDTTSGRIDLA